MKKVLFLLLSTSYIFASNYKFNCHVPHNIMEAIKLTENASRYPYYIRVNPSKKMKITNRRIDIFNKVANNYEHKRVSKYLLDCKNTRNCVNISNDLIQKGVRNLDLGLFQINYGQFPDNLYKYFNHNEAYKKACSVLTEKIIYDGEWNWSVVADYHSRTPKLNRKYMKKVIRNYMKITNLSMR